MSISTSLQMDLAEIDKELESINKEVELLDTPVKRNKKGYFGIGIYFPSKEINCSTLFRSALSFGADFIFTIGREYKPSAADTCKSFRHTPCFNYKNFEDFYSHIPMGCRLVGVENLSRTHRLENFIHPLQSIYLLGTESSGLPPKVLSKCHAVVEIPSSLCLNVSVAGSIVLYDRVSKQ